MLLPALIVYDVLLVVVFVICAKLAPRASSIDLIRRHDPVLSVRTSNTVTLQIENNDARTIQLKVRDEPPEFCKTVGNETELTIGSGRLHEWRYTLTPMRRGEGKFAGTFVRVLAPLGLAWVERRIDNEEAIRVYPNVKALRDFDLLKQRGKLSAMGVRRTRKRGLGTEFESLRDYNEDDFRHIDWKSSARRGKLVVRQFEQEKNQAVVIAIDVGRRMLSEVGGVTKLDYALDASLMLMHAAQDAGDQVGLLVFNDAVQRYIAPRKGRAQTAALLNAIHDLQAEPVESDYVRALGYFSAKWKRRSFFVLFTDCDDAEESRSLISGLKAISARHLVIVVRVADPGLRELLVLSPETESMLYDRAAATWFETSRRHARVMLQAAGLRNLESEPQSLIGALVSSYWQVKETSAI